MSASRTCDGCGKTAPSVGRSIPVGWLSMTVRMRQKAETFVTNLGPPLEICSAECASHAVQKLVKSRG